MASSTSKRARLSIDVPSSARRRIRIAAAKRDLPVSKYVLEAVEARLKEDLGDEADHDGLFALTAKADPVLAAIWDNDKDAAYDSL